MTFLEELTAHKGGLILLRSDLFWYGGRGWDGARDRVCLLLNTAAADDLDGAAARATGAAPAAVLVDEAVAVVVAALLLIDGQPHWVWVAQEDVELLS